MMNLFPLRLVSLMLYLLPCQPQPKHSQTQVWIDWVCPKRWVIVHFMVCAKKFVCSLTTEIFLMIWIRRDSYAKVHSMTTQTIWLLHFWFKLWMFCKIWRSSLIVHFASISHAVTTWYTLFSCGQFGQMISNFLYTKAPLAHPRSPTPAPQPSPNPDTLRYDCTPDPKPPTLLHSTH